MEKSAKTQCEGVLGTGLLLLVLALVLLLRPPLESCPCKLGEQRHHVGVS